MKSLLLCLPLLLTGCPTLGDSPWSRANTEIELWVGNPDIPGDSGTLGDVAEMVASTSPSSAADVETVRTVLFALNNAIGLAMLTGEEGGIDALIDESIRAIDALIQGIEHLETKAHVQAGMILVKAALRRWRAYS